MQKKKTKKRTAIFNKTGATLKKHQIHYGGELIKTVKYFDYLGRGGQVHAKTVSHVCHRLEIPKPIQSLKKARNL